jgi:hypothetical protein
MAGRGRFCAGLSCGIHVLHLQAWLNCVSWREPKCLPSRSALFGKAQGGASEHGLIIMIIITRFQSKDGLGTDWALLMGDTSYGLCLSVGKGANVLRCAYDVVLCVTISVWYVNNEVLARPTCKCPGRPRCFST